MPDTFPQKFVPPLTLIEGPRDPGWDVDRKRIYQQRGEFLLLNDQ